MAGEGDCAARPKARAGPLWLQRRIERLTICQQAAARDGSAAVCGAAAVGEALVGKRVDGGLARRGHEEAHHVVRGEQHAEGALDAWFGLGLGLGLGLVSSMQKELSTPGLG